MEIKLDECFQFGLGAFETVIAVDNSDGTISTGLSAKVTFLSEESEDNNEDQKE